MDEEMVKTALEEGANANLSSPTGSRPLHAAALRGSASIIYALVEHGAKVDQTDSEGYTPLMVAALNGRADAVMTLLASGAGPSLRRLDTGETALHMAMDGGSRQVVRALLEAGADVNSQTTKEKMTPLHYAAELDAKNMADVLLGDILCQAETKDRSGRTAARVARDKGHNRLAEHLDLCTAPKSESDKRLALAVMQRREEKTRKALKAGANANLSSPTGSRPLHAAALRGSASIIYALVEHGAKVDQTDSEGYTPLMVAALNGKADAVKALLASGVGTSLQRLNTGETALHMAMKGGSPEVVRALLKAGADVNSQTTKEKMTPLHFAYLFNSMDLAEILKNNPHCNSYDKHRAEMLGRAPGHKTRMAPDTADGGGVKPPLRVTFPEKPVPPSDSVYKVWSTPRGRVLILNYEKFKGKLENRQGATRDTCMLKNLFEEMGYHVTVKMDLNKESTKSALRSFCDSDGLGKVDCAAVCVLTHGRDSDTFATSDCEEMTVGEVYAFFTDARCPSLRGKPKLFVFNFCRGDYTETGCVLDRKDACDEQNVAVEGTEEPDTSGKREALKDRISLFATVEGVSALRSTCDGSFFIQAIYRTFPDLAHNHDVEEMAKKVNEYMTLRMQGTTTETNSTLRKKFYLNPTKM